VRKLAYVDPVQLAAGFAAVIAVLAILGAANVMSDGDVAFFDLDAEGKLPAFAPLLAARAWLGIGVRPAAAVASPRAPAGVGR
jgi:hypothetical protein